MNKLTLVHFPRSFESEKYAVPLLKMLQYFEKLRSAPLKERRKAALGFTALVVGVIGVLWFVLLVFDVGQLFKKNINSTNDNQNTLIQGPYE